MSNSKVVPRASLREALRQARLAMPAAQRTAADQAIAARLDRLLPMNTPLRLAVYWPHAGEPDLRAWMRERHHRGWTLVLPSIVTAAAPLVFLHWTPESEMTPDRYGIPIPAGSAVLTPEVVLVPTLGFTVEGYRLGYGGGYYDRTLAALRPRPRAIGIAYEQGRTGDFAPAAHDVALDAIVTESAVHAPRQTP